jgi:hypothetical protein
MTKDEIYEEIRSQLREAQEATVTTPWRYDDKDLVPQIRSALRYLRTVGLPVLAVMDTSGTFETDPTETEGLLIALRVVNRLLTGDLMRKLLDGELGVVFRTGSDLIDTKTASTVFESASSRSGEEFDRLLTIALANTDGGSRSIFGLQSLYQE